jgi:hypothetical protein
LRHIIRVHGTSFAHELFFRLLPVRALSTMGPTFSLPYLVGAVSDCVLCRFHGDALPIERPSERRNTSGGARSAPSHPVFIGQRHRFGCDKSVIAADVDSNAC